MSTPRVRRSVLISLLLLSALAASSVAAAKPSGVSGRVVDRSGDPVPGALVTFACGGAPETAAVRTDENGRFLSPRLPEGECTIEASLPAMDCRASVKRRVAAGQADEVELKLDMDMLCEHIAVKGATVRDGVETREIRESFARDPGEALTHVDGVSKVRKGGIANDVVVRGFKGDNLNVLIDGQRVYGACPNRMDPPAFHVDFAEVERIDVKKGPFDLTSSGSLGGTVNVVTREPEAGVHASAQAAAGSYAYVAPSVTASYAAPSWSVKGGYAARRGDPFEDGEGVPFTERAAYLPGAADGRAFDIWTGWVGASLTVRPAHRLEIQATRQEGDRQLYPYLLMDADYDDASRVTAAYKAQGPFGAVEGIEASLAYSEVNHFMTDALRTSSTGTPRGYSMATEARSAVVSERLQARFFPGITLGVEAYQRNWDTTTVMAGMGYAAQASIPDVSVRSAGAYALLERKLSDAWKVEAGLRLDRAESEADPALANTNLYFAFHDTRSTSSTDSLWSASMSATFAPAANWELFAGLGRTTRPPDPEERYIALKRKSEDWVGNPLLVPPENTEADLGARFRSGGLSLEASLFAASISDFIAVADAERVNLVAGVTDTNARSFVNNDARMRGGEATVRWAFGERSALSAGVSYVRGEQDLAPEFGVSDPDLPEMPPMTGRLSYRYDTGRWFAEAEGVAAAAQDRVSDDLQESRTPGWGVVHLRGGVNLSGVSVLAGVANVFDRFYRESLSYQRDPYRSGVQVPEPGRSYSVSVLLRY